MTRNWLLRWASVLLGVLLAACGGKQPQIADSRFKLPTVDHTRFTDPCATCHESTRLPSSDELQLGSPVKVAHGLGASCGQANCHVYNPTTLWKPIAFTHNPAPTSCWGCHAVTRETGGHEARGDCVSCHVYKANWKVGN